MQPMCINSFLKLVKHAEHNLAHSILIFRKKMLNPHEVRFRQKLPQHKFIAYFLNFYFSQEVPIAIK